MLYAWKCLVGCFACLFLRGIFVHNIQVENALYNCHVMTLLKPWFCFYLIVKIKVEQNVGCVSCHLLIKHSWGWGGNLNLGPASCKRPLAGRSTCPQGTPARNRKDLPVPAAFLPPQVLSELLQLWEGGEELGRSMSLLLSFPAKSCVSKLLFTLSLLAVPGTAFSGFSAFISCLPQSYLNFIWDQCSLSLPGCDGY